MRRRVQIALAVLLVTIIAVVAFQVLRPQEHEPVYQGKPLSAWLRDYGGWDTTPAEWVKAKRRAEDAVRQIGTNAVPTLLEMLGKTQLPRSSKLMELWDRHVANVNYFPFWVRHPAWYKHQARYLNMEGEIGFKILGADAQQAVPELMNIYQRTLSMDSLSAMDSRVAVSRALIDIGPAAIPPFLRWAASTNEDERLIAVHALSQIHARPSEVVPVLVKFLSHTNVQVRIEVAEGLGNFEAEARQTVPALVQLLSDRNGIVRESATNTLKKIDPEAAAKAGVK